MVWWILVLVVYLVAGGCIIYSTQVRSVAAELIKRSHPGCIIEDFVEKDDQFTATIGMPDQPLKTTLRFCKSRV